MDHEVLTQIIMRKIRDPRVLWLIKLIIDNHKTASPGKGMPIGNLTSQFFANVYLNELDKFVKHVLKAKYYIRYVDDFVILHENRRVLEQMQSEVDSFLKENLKIELHSDKTKIISLNSGVTFLGYRIFNDYKLLKKSNQRRIWKRIDAFKLKYYRGEISEEKVKRSVDGWMNYARFANTHALRKRILEHLQDIP